VWSIDIPLQLNNSMFDPIVVAEIGRRLDALRHDERLDILLAVESGSRAWGFPSPDSDYDCRLIYVRAIDDYLSLFAPRDVLEVPLEGVLDIGGWDLAKALRLLLKGNAVVVEWLMSPHAYLVNREFRDECLALARHALHPHAVARHYLHLGERQRRTYFADFRAIPLKKIFYALRPAMALRWLRLHPGEAIAPMHFPTLMAQCEVADDVVAVTEELLARKSATRELGTGLLPRPIAEFIDHEFVMARDGLPRQPLRPDKAAIGAADVLFRRWINMGS
jgi:predicted nucleotidyltransferase